MGNLQKQTDGLTLTRICATGLMWLAAIRGLRLHDALSFGSCLASFFFANLLLGLAVAPAAAGPRHRGVDSLPDM